MRGALFVVLLALAALAAGCGTEQSASSDSEAPKDASSSRIDMSLLGGAPSGSFSGTGAIDYERNRGWFRLKVPAGAVPNDVQMIFRGSDLYMGMRLLGEMRWQKSSDPQDSGTDRFIPGPGGPWPDRLLALLTEWSENVEPAGEDTVRGTKTKHYRAQLDKARLRDRYDPKLEDDLVADVWVDEAGLARRVRVPLGGKEDPAYLVDIYDFGVDVDVELPPSDEIVSEEEFSKLLERECLKQRRTEASGQFPFCAVLVGESGTDSGTGYTGYGPTETMPRRVTDGK